MGSNQVSALRKRPDGQWHLKNGGKRAMEWLKLVPGGDYRRKRIRAGIKNQRPAAVRGFGPFEGPSSNPQLCCWSLIEN